MLNTSTSSTAVIDQAAKAIASATHLYFTAGAGMGVDSGLPDFRGKNGFWKAYPPMQKLGLEFHQMSNPKWFERDPTFAHGFFAHRYNLYTSKLPHHGYHILKELSEMPNIQDYFIFTSNVDGHFAQVFPQEKIAECHGCILYLQCTNSSTCEDIYSVKKHNEFYAETHPETCYPLPVDMESFRVPEKSLPKCIHCGSLARPNIMMFGDYGFVGDRSNEQEDRLRESFIKWREGIDKTKNVENQIHLVTIEIGAGVDVNTVRCESEEKTRKYANIDHVKTTLIRINPTDHQIQQFSIGKGVGIEIPLGGLDALTQIKQRIAELK